MVSATAAGGSVSHLQCSSTFFSTSALSAMLDSKVFGGGAGLESLLVLSARLATS